MTHHGAPAPSRFTGSHIVALVALGVIALGIFAFAYANRGGNPKTATDAIALATTPAATATAPAATPTKTLPDIKVNPEVAKVVEGYLKDSSITLEAAKSQIKSLGYTDAQIEAYIKELLAQKALGTSPTPAATATAPATTPTMAPTPNTAPPVPAAGSKPPVKSNFDLPAQKDTFSSNNWAVTTYVGVTDQMVNWFKQVRPIAPELWPTTPNVPNPLVPEFRSEECRLRLDPNAQPGAMCVPDGMYVGLGERNQCPQVYCAAIVAARGDLEISGDYDLGFISHYASDDQLGSAALIINVGNVTAAFEDIHIKHGFTVEGHYFNGDTLWWGIWSTASHRTAAMLNYPVIANALTGQVLNAGDSPDDVNSGANCSIPEGCKGVHYTVVITSGNQILAIAKSVFMKPASIKTSAPPATEDVSSLN